ncbi:MAG: ABC transporter ATP-binding protein [Bacilli bacterium]|nr:ABC transporter ATP-binding protein [Bacilli bacterium]
MLVLECNKVFKKIGHHVIVSDLSFSLNEGDILGFIGPNGAGKTTSIKLMLGLQSLSGGSVKILGYDIKKDFVKAIRQVGAIVENPDLYMYLTGYENLKIASVFYQVDKNRIDEVVRLVGLEERIHDEVKNYSLGMRQRLGIAVAILHRPKLLILDEPMNGLDPEGIKDLKNILTTLARDYSMAIIISSHILSELESFCTRICIFSKGRVEKDASIAEIKRITKKERYCLEVSDTNLDSILTSYRVLDNEHIEVSTTRENIVNILKALLLNDIFVYEVKREVLSLEDVFLKVMEASHDI